MILHIGMVKKKGRQDRDRIHEAWLMNRGAWLPGVPLHLYSWLFGSMTFSYFQAVSPDYCVFNTSPRQQYRYCVMGLGVSACSNLFINHGGV